MQTQAQGAVAPVTKADAALVGLAVSWLQACVERDDAYILQHSLDDLNDAFRCIGSSGEPFPLHPFAEHLRGLKKAGWDGLEPAGWIRGDTAWFAGSAHGLLPSGEPLLIRITLVMLKAGDAWKAIHCHVSESVHRNGVELDA